MTVRFFANGPGWNRTHLTGDIKNRVFGMQRRKIRRTRFHETNSRHRTNSNHNRVAYPEICCRICLTTEQHFPILTKFNFQL